MNLNEREVAGPQNPVHELALPGALAPALQSPPVNVRKAKTPKTPGEPRSKLRVEGEFLSVYDIINLVLEKEPGSDARDRFKGYRYVRTCIAPHWAKAWSFVFVLLLLAVRSESSFHPP
jgi:hypothetical protein